MSDTDATTETTETAAAPAPSPADLATPAQATTEADTPTDWQAKYQETLAHSRKHEQRAKENAAAAKELAELKQAQMTEQQRAEAAASEATERAEAAERRAALAEAAIQHGLTADDLELLADVPADKIDDRAKRLAERINTVAPATKSGTSVTGEPDRGTEMDPAKIAANAANRKPRMNIF